jgi:ABC-type phosphate transport system auxiliary subunit
MKDELELAAVIVAHDGQLVDGGAALLAALDDARSVEVKPPNAKAIEQMHRSALDWVTADVAAREQELQARNDETITAQIESLRLSSDRRRLWFQEQIQENPSAPIVRMRKAQLARLETEFETKLGRLEGRRGVSVGYRLVAAGLVVRPHG